MTKDDLKRIEAYCAAAMPGPWWNDDATWIEVNDITVYCGDKDDPTCLCQMGYPIEPVDDKRRGKQAWVNGQFIASARTDLPAVVAALREAWKEIERLSKVVRRDG